MLGRVRIKTKTCRITILPEMTWLLDISFWMTWFTVTMLHKSATASEELTYFVTATTQIALRTELPVGSLSIYTFTHLSTPQFDPPPPQYWTTDTDWLQKPGIQTPQVSRLDPGERPSAQWSSVGQLKVPASPYHYRSSLTETLSII